MAQSEASAVGGAGRVEDLRLAWLARLVNDGQLSEEDAARLYQEMLEDGQAPELPPAPKVDWEAWRAAAVGLLVSLRIQQITARPMPYQPSEVRVDRLQNWWLRRSTAHAHTYDPQNLAAWSGRVQQDLAHYLTAQAHAGAVGYYRPPAGPTLATVVEQQAYLLRFLDALALAQQQGIRVTPAAIENRLSLYGGAGRAEYWRTNIQAHTQWGLTLVRYVAVDDRNTCFACHNAAGLYAPEVAPRPGALCYGSGRCRCRLEYIYDSAGLL